jgi:valyl-tRNA synthetase
VVSGEWIVKNPKLTTHHSPLTTKQMEIAKAYNPKEAEETHYQIWEKNGCFAPEINENPAAVPFSIVIPPPNVTGSLHMGHALQHTLMDTLTRWKRMQGYKTLFLVGVDHAGISTQLMVTRQLKQEERKTPQEIGREAFTERGLGLEGKIRRRDHAPDSQRRPFGRLVARAFHDGRKPLQSRE